MRDTPARAPLRKEFRSRDELRELLLRLSREEKNQEMLEAERKAMLKFGLIPKDFPYIRFTLELLTEQVAGFYDYRTRSLNLLDTTPPELQIPVLAHELTHAIQEQSINLKEFIDPSTHNDDLTEAHQSLVEGDATAMMLDFLMKPLGRNLNTLGFDIREMIQQGSQMTTANLKIFREAPRAIRTTLTAPYLYGASFFQYFRRQNEWPRIKALYRDPPSSMEQIMHPDKYFLHRDDPVLIRFAPAPPSFLKKWKLVETNVLGELGLLIVLQQFLNDENARIASEGWGGDHYQLFEDGAGHLLLALFTTWDTPEDAVQFFNSYRILLETKYKPLKVVTAAEHNDFCWDSEGESVGLQIRDHDVIVIEGAPADEYNSLRDWLWQSKKEMKARAGVLNMEAKDRK